MADHTLKVILTDEDEQPRVPTSTPPPTRRVDAMDVSATRRVSESCGEGRLLPLGIQEAGTLLCADCRVERTLYPHESQRPGLYLCAAKEGRVIVKVYATQFPPKPELWQRLPFLQHTNVIRTFRTFEENGYFFEVQEYCGGGTLDERTPRPGSNKPPVPASWIIDVMLPQVCSGLRYLHEQEIIHRDIKPANIYLTQDGAERLVLADFDISSVLEETRTSRDTQRAGGTWLYTAPEAFPRFVDDHASTRRGRVTRASDYYSLGITIIELLMGTTSLHMCQLPDLFDFYLQGGRVEIPQGLPGRLPVLLRGLLVRDRQTRWGSAEVERWLRNANTAEDLQRIDEDEYFELARASRPYRLNGRHIFDLPGLAEAMFHDQELATEDLITGDILLNWIGGISTTVAREIRRDRDRWYLTPERVLYRAIMRCDPTRPFIFSDGVEITSPSEWITHAIQLLRTSNSPIAVAQLRQLEAWLRLKQDAQPEMADAVEAIQERTPERVQLEELAYLFQPDRSYPIMRGVVARTPQEVACLSYGEPGDWLQKRPFCYEASYQRWYDGALTAWLRQRGLAEVAAQCDDIRERLGEDTYAAFETALRLLDPSLPPVEVELDLTDLTRKRTVPYGTTRTCTVTFTTRGCGMPFGAIRVLPPAIGIQVLEHTIRKRKGTFDITLDARYELQVNTTYTAALELDSGIAVFRHTPVRFSYSTAYPAEAIAMRLCAGAGIGALLFGFPRLLACLLGRWRPVSIADTDFSRIWQATKNYDYPLLGLTLAVVILIIFLFFAIRMWMMAIRRSEI